MGAPDLMYQKKGQLDHALAMMHEGKFTVPLGVAVQDGNYIGETGSTNVVAKGRTWCQAFTPLRRISTRLTIRSHISRRTSCLVSQ